jgi:cytidylate kinase
MHRLTLREYLCTPNPDLNVLHDSTVVSAKLSRRAKRAQQVEMIWTFHSAAGPDSFSSLEHNRYDGIYNIEIDILRVLLAKYRSCLFYYFV